MISLHPVDQLVRIEATAAELRAFIAADREARVGATHHAIVTRIDDRDHVVIEPLPDLREVLDLLTGALVVIDTETTGLHPHNGDRMISLGCLPITAAGTRCATLKLTVNPGRPSSPQAQAVHGMTDRELALLPRFSYAMAGQVVRFLSDWTLVAHNAPFDMGFLQREMESVGAPFDVDSRVVVDTRIVSKLLWPDQSGSLDALATRLGVDRGNRDARHDALSDARLLANCIPGLVAAIRERLA